MKKALAFLALLILSAPLSAEIRSVFTFPGGSTGDVQLNRGGVFGSTNTLHYSTATSNLSTPQVTLSTINFVGGGSITSASGIITAGDDMGDHTAGQNVQMSGFALLNIGSQGSEFTGTGGLTMRALTTLSTTTITAPLTVSSAAVFGGQLTVTGSSVSINGVNYQYPAGYGTSGTAWLNDGLGGIYFGTVASSGTSTSTGPLNMQNQSISNIGSAGSSFNSVGALTVNSTTTITNGVLSIGGLPYVYPSTASGSALIYTYNSASGVLTPQTAITDAARKAGVNVMTATNTFTIYGPLFQEVTTQPLPAVGYRRLIAKSDGFYQQDSAGTLSQVGTGSGGGGGWTDNGLVIHSTPTNQTVLIGTNSTSESNIRFKVANGNSDLFKVTVASTVFSSISSMTLTDVSTITYSQTYFDVSGSTFVIPSFTSNPGFVNNQMWFDSDDHIFYIGTSSFSVSSGSGGGGISGNTIYPATATASFPFGFTATAATFTASVAVGTITAAAGSITIAADLDFRSADSLTLSSMTFSHSGITLIASTSPTTVSADQNNYPLPDFEIVRSSASNNVSFTGFANGVDKRTFALVNVGSTTITIPHESASSTDTNRVLVGAPGSSLSITANQSVRFWYDGISQRWRRLD